MLCGACPFLLDHSFDVIVRDALEPLHELSPINHPIVADDRDCRDSATFHNHVALRCGFDPAHDTNAVLQPTRHTQSLITEFVEKTQETSLYRGSGTCSAERRDILNCLLADSSRIGSRAALDTAVKADRLPVDEF